MDLQPMTTSPCRHSPFLSRKELHTACFPFAKLLYVYLFIRDHSTFPCNPHGGRGLWASAHQAYFPSYKHTAFYFPPFAKANGPPFSPERETCCILSVNQLLHACLLTKWKKCNIVSLFLQIHIVESTIHHSLMRMDSRQRIVSNACKSLIS